MIAIIQMTCKCRIIYILLHQPKQESCLPPPRLELNASDEDDGPYETMENNNIPNNNKINDEHNNNNNNNVEDNYDGDDGSDNEDDTIEFIAERRVCQIAMLNIKCIGQNNRGT